MRAPFVIELRALVVAVSFAGGAVLPPVLAAVTLTACTRGTVVHYPTITSQTSAPTYAYAAPSATSVQSDTAGEQEPAPSVVNEPDGTFELRDGVRRESDATQLAPEREPAALLPFQRLNYGSSPLRADATARRIGNLSPGACAKELSRWKTSFKRVGPHKGIATPVRVIGPIEGVKFRVPGEKSKFGVLDCRLALTLVEFARFLAPRDVTEVVVDNFYRINARLPSSRAKRSQHAYGLAIDLRSFRLADGRVWDVEKDWGASTDTEACGADATLVNPTEHTEGLRTLVCELFVEQIFTHHLTPSHDAAHRNHLHLDVKRGATSAVVR